MADFSHLGPGAAAAVIGASGGIGGAFVRLLDGAPGIDRVHAFSRGGAPVGGTAHPGRLDLEDEASIAAAAAGIEEGALRLVIVASGLLHDGAMMPEKTWRDVSPDAFARSFAINATGPALAAKHFLPRMPRRGPAVYAVLSARVGSISDNAAGGWYAYRAAKAAVNQVIRCLAIEEARRRRELVIVGLQPGTVRTALSAPFRGAVPAERLMDPDVSAAHLLDVLAGLQPGQSGRLFDWSGAEFPP